jgi:hypothetical protein
MSQLVGVKIREEKNMSSASHGSSRRRSRSTSRRRRRSLSASNNNKKTNSSFSGEGCETDLTTFLRKTRPWEDAELWQTYRGWICCWLRCRYGKQCARDFELEIAQRPLTGVRPCFRVPQIPVFINDIPKGEKNATGIHVVTHRLEPIVSGGLWTLRSFVYQPSKSDPLVLLGTFAIPLTVEAQLSCDCPLFARSCIVAPPPIPSHASLELGPTSKPWIEQPHWFVIMSQYQKDIDCITNQLNTLKAAAAAANAGVAKLQAENNALKSQLQQAANKPAPDNTALIAEVARLKGEVAQLGKIGPAKDKDMAELKAANTQLQKARQEAEQKAGSIKADADSKGQKVKELETQLATVQKQIGSADAAVQAQKKQCDDAKAALQQLKDLCKPTGLSVRDRAADMDRVGVPGARLEGGRSAGMTANSNIIYRRVVPNIRPSLRTAGSYYSGVVDYQHSINQHHNQHHLQKPSPSSGYSTLPPIHVPVRLPQQHSQNHHFQQH